jgi:hypothetical protein
MENLAFDRLIHNLNYIKNNLSDKDLEEKVKKLDIDLVEYLKEGT